MCAHNGQNWNCSQCCFPAVQNTCFPPPFFTSPCVPRPVCQQVSPCGFPNPPVPPSNNIFLQYATIALGPVEFFANPLQKYTIIPAPGQGLMIEPILTTAIIVPAALLPVAYDDGFGSPPNINFNIGSNILFNDPTILGNITNITRFYSLSNNVVGADGVVCNQVYTNQFNNLPLEVGASVVPTAGNGTLYIRVLYAITNI